MIDENKFNDVRLSNGVTTFTEIYPRAYWGEPPFVLEQRTTPDKIHFTLLDKGVPVAVAELSIVDIFNYVPMVREIIRERAINATR